MIYLYASYFVCFELYVINRLELVRCRFILVYSKKICFQIPGNLLFKQRPTGFKKNFVTHKQRTECLSISLCTVKRYVVKFLKLNFQTKVESKRKRTVKSEQNISKIVSLEEIIGDKGA